MLCYEECTATDVHSVLRCVICNNKTSDINLVSLYSTIKMMHGPINIRISFFNDISTYMLVSNITSLVVKLVRGNVCITISSGFQFSC